MFCHTFTPKQGELWCGSLEFLRPLVVLSINPYRCAMPRIPLIFIFTREFNVSVLNSLSYNPCTKKEYNQHLNTNISCSDTDYSKLKSTDNV